MSEQSRQPPALSEQLAVEAAHYHLPAQLGRFLYLFAGSLAVQVQSGAHIAGWADLRSLLFGAAVLAWRQWRKTLPLPTAQRIADEHERPSSSAPAGM